jgi:DNA primase
VKAALQLQSLGIKARVAVLPDGKDPNEATADEVVEAFFRAVPITTASATKLLLGLKSK